ncbi:esterase family protein [Planomonospora sp. ID91781]|uniref:alpha/beta hydrolase n=1 Tax=Planomonospora sp. ID91781 TaxID=2738135 RepID=UPI0018C3CDE7|nr:alpha/beta hydrolase family protein [Planomonospora sp. ID91781]MBG0822354.1 esterase family protein [Planomonospora sp. ID91781]
MNRKAVRLGVILLAALAVAAVSLTLLTPFSPGSPSGSSHSASPGGGRDRTPSGVRVERLGERDHVLTFASAALGREGRVRVLLPAGWKPGSGPWPVLYLLDGCCQPAPDSWVTEGDATRLTSPYPVITVMPEGGAVGFYSDWRRGPKWETFHLTEVRAILERDYGAGDRRAVAGLSMGGFGAVSYAARHPGMFRAAASFSGVLDTTESAPWLLERHGEDPRDLWGPPGGSEQAAHNPVALTSKLAGVRLYVSCGDGAPGPLDDPSAARDDGEATLLTQSQEFARRAGKAGLEVTTDFYGPGTHSWPYWRRALERSLPLLMDAVGASR